MQKEIYNLTQWHWAADRVSEGYASKDVADFLGVSVEGLLRARIAIGRWLEPGDRAPLSMRKDEFNALAGDGSPLRTQNTAVVGVYKDGTRRWWPSMTAAASALGVYTSSILSALKTTGNCKGWRLSKDTERERSGAQ